MLHDGLKFLQNIQTLPSIPLATGHSHGGGCDYRHSTREHLFRFFETLSRIVGYTDVVVVELRLGLKSEIYKDRRFIVIFINDVFLNLKICFDFHIACCLYIRKWYFVF